VLPVTRFVGIALGVAGNKDLDIRSSEPHYKGGRDFQQFRQNIQGVLPFLDEVIRDVCFSCTCLVGFHRNHLSNYSTYAIPIASRKNLYETGNVAS